MIDEDELSNQRTKDLLVTYSPKRLGFFQV